MKLFTTNLVIELNEEEIYMLWDALMFALDWQHSELTKNEAKMSEGTESFVKFLKNKLEYLK